MPVWFWLVFGVWWLMFVISSGCFVWAMATKTERADRDT